MSPARQIWSFVTMFIILGVSLHFCLLRLGDQPDNFWLCVGCLWLLGVGVSTRLLHLGHSPHRRHRWQLRRPATTS